MAERHCYVVEKTEPRAHAVIGEVTVREADTPEAAFVEQWGTTPAKATPGSLGYRDAVIDEVVSDDVQASVGVTRRDGNGFSRFEHIAGPRP